jgi:hypothetical protein
MALSELARVFDLIAEEFRACLRTPLRSSMTSATARDFQWVAGLLDSALTEHNGQARASESSDGQGVTITIRGGKKIESPLFYKILRQPGVSQEEFERMR